MDFDREQYKKKYKPQWMWIGTLIVVIHFVCYMAINTENGDGVGSIVFTVLNEFIAVLIITLVFAAAYRCERGGRLLPALGRASLVIYLLHTYIVTAMKVVAIRAGVCKSLFMDVVVIVLSVIVPIAICYFADWVRRKNRLVGAVFAPRKFIESRIKI